MQGRQIPLARRIRAQSDPQMVSCAPGMLTDDRSTPAAHAVITIPDVQGLPGPPGLRAAGTRVQLLLLLLRRPQAQHAFLQVSMLQTLCNCTCSCLCISMFTLAYGYHAVLLMTPACAMQEHEQQDRPAIWPRHLPVRLLLQSMKPPVQSGLGVLLLQVRMQRLM